MHRTKPLNGIIGLAKIPIVLVSTSLYSTFLDTSSMNTRPIESAAGKKNLKLQSC